MNSLTSSPKRLGWRPAELPKSGIPKAQLPTSKQGKGSANVMSASTNWKSHRFATRKAQEFVKKFAVEMWKKGGIRMVILSGFKDEKGEIFAQV